MSAYAEMQQLALCLDKQPWQMSLTEFAASVTVRVDTERPMTFEQWARSKGIEPISYLTETEYATMIGDAVFGRPDKTAREAGKLKSLVERYERRQELQAQYIDEVQPTAKQRPLYPDRECDQAYIRVQHKRAIRKAISEGENVPTSVIAEHPILAGYAA